MSALDHALCMMRDWNRAYCDEHKVLMLLCLISDRQKDVGDYWAVVDVLRFSQKPDYFSKGETPIQAVENAIQRLREMTQC